MLRGDQDSSSVVGHELLGIDFFIEIVVAALIEMVTVFKLASLRANV